MEAFRRNPLLLVQATILLLLFVQPMTCAANDKHSSCDTIDVDDGSCIVDLSVMGPIKVIVHGTKNDPFWQQVQAGMVQTAEDMKIGLEMTLYDDEKESELAQAMVDDLKQYAVYGVEANEEFLPPRPAALIVSLPGDSNVEGALHSLQHTNIPIFGINALGSNNNILEGMVSMDEKEAGEIAGDAIRNLLISKGITPDGTTGIYINHRSDVDALSERFDALSAATEDIVESWEMVHMDKSTTEEELNAIFEGCADTVIQLAGGSGTVDAILAALVANGCNIENNHIVGTFDTSAHLIYDAMAEGTIDFAISQQPYLQGSNAVLMAALYATTGQKLGGASASPSNVHTGPILITAKDDNFPTKEQQACENEGFPVCSPHRKAGSHSNCPCTDRSKMSIAVITHDESSEFWDNVFSGISQAANDFGVSIEKNRFKRVTPPNMRKKMRGEPRTSRLKHTFDINEACLSKSTAGLIVSLPDATMVDSLAPCVSNDIPYLAINAVANFDDDDLQYVGQKDYESGLEAGKRLIKAGANQGWCLVHANFDTIAERCRGMEKAFTQANKDFMGIINVPSNDDIPLYKFIVEEKIGEEVEGDNWDNVGVLSTGRVQIPGLLSLIDDHPNMFAGTFDLDSSLYMNGDSTLPDQIVFGIDQNAYMEGYLSVASMVWRISTSEKSTTTTLETGPNFVENSDLSVYQHQECRNKDIKFCGAKQTVYSIPSEVASDEESPYVEQPLKLPGKCANLGRKCGVCEGDCDDDTDCGEGLVCFIRDSNTKGQSETPPGCNTNPIEWGAKDFCVDSRLYQCKDDLAIEVRVGTFTMSRTCAYVADDLNRCKEFGRFCRETCGYCRKTKDEDRETSY